NWAPAGTTAEETVHAVPSHASARAEPSDVPTAMHVVADAHATANTRLSRAPCGVGMCTTDQAVPSQCSASAEWRPSFPKASPTAMQVVAFGHATPFRMLARAPAGFGVDWITHLV